MKVKVILKEDIKGVGKKDEIVEVKDGYANNFLLKNNKGILATADALNKLQAKKDKKIRNHKQDTEKANELKIKLEEKILTLKVKAGDNGKVFGSVGSKEIADLIKQELDLEIDKKKISSNSRLKEIGLHLVEIKLYENIKAKLRIDILEDK